MGHSYGGAVITEAGANPKVKSLAYIAAFVPDVGESVAALNEAPEEPGETKAPLLAPQDGYLVVDRVRFPVAFAADVDPATKGRGTNRSRSVAIRSGENDPIFLSDGARACLRDIPETELHFFDTGHFALEDKADEMIPVMRDFLARNLTQ